MTKCYFCDNEGTYADDEYIDGEIIYWCDDCLYHTAFGDTKRVEIVLDNGNIGYASVDKDVSPETIEALGRIIDAAYEMLAKREIKGVLDGSIPTYPIESLWDDIDDKKDAL